MAQGKSSNKIGSWAFLLGVILAIVLGVLGPFNATWIMILVVIGLIVGLLNVSSNETQSFLWSGAVLIFAAYAGGSAIQSIGMLYGVLQAMLAIFVPAVIIVAIKNVFSLARH